MTLFRSTKGASKQRRDLINVEISHMRDMLPLPESARQRLSQLQIMSMACCYIRKCNYFSRLFGNGDAFDQENQCFPFSQALHGFLLITTTEGKLLYISENITEYLGHSMVDMMTQGDSLYDIIDKRDHGSVQSKLGSAFTQTTGQTQEQLSGQEKTFFCRMNVARSFRRQAGFGDHKMMHIRGHFVQPDLPDHYGNQPVFMAVCSPLVTPDIKETATQNSTMSFQSVHGLDLKFIEISHIGEHHLGYSEEEVFGKSLYEFLHPDDLQEAQEKHTLLIKSSHEMGCMLTVRLQNKAGCWVWVNTIMHIRQPFICDSGEPAIVCICHVIQESEAQHFKLQSQLYSSHVASSPEYLPQGSSPPHTITQVCVEQDQYNMRSAYSASPHGAPHEDTSSFYGHIGMTMAAVPDGGNSGVRGGHPVDEIRLSDSTGNQGDGKKLKREEIIRMLKRKMTDSPVTEQCRPAKSPRLVSHQDPSGPMSGVSYTGSIITADYNEGYGGRVQTGSGDVQMMTSSYQYPTYAPIGIKYKQEAQVKEAMFSTRKGLDSMMPLTPESPASDGGLGLSIEVEQADAAVVPLSILTPDASPMCSPTESNFDSSTELLPLEVELSTNDMSFYAKIAEKEKSKVCDAPQRSLPFLDLPSVEDYLTAMAVPTMEKPPPPYTARSPLPLANQAQAHTIEKVPSMLVNNHITKHSEDVLSLNDEEFKLLMSEAIFNIMTDPTMKEEVFDVDLGMEDTTGSVASSPQLPASPEDASIINNFIELHQLSEELANSPSYGDSALTSSLFNQTL